MKLKPGVRLKNLSPQMVLAAMIVETTFSGIHAECTITSGNDSGHMANSLHYAGNALDFRTKDFLGDKRALASLIKAELGQDFDVLLENLGEDNEHLHVEYDPKP